MENSVLNQKSLINLLKILLTLNKKYIKSKNICYMKSVGEVYPNFSMLEKCQISRKKKTRCTSSDASYLCCNLSINHS